MRHRPWLLAATLLVPTLTGCGASRSGTQIGAETGCLDSDLQTDALEYVDPSEIPEGFDMSPDDTVAQLLGLYEGSTLPVGGSSWADGLDAALEIVSVDTGALSLTPLAADPDDPDAECVETWQARVTADVFVDGEVDGSVTGSIRIWANGDRELWFQAIGAELPATPPAGFADDPALQPALKGAFDWTGTSWSGAYTWEALDTDQDVGQPASFPDPVFAGAVEVIGV